MGSKHMGIIGNEKADQEAKKYAAVLPTPMTKGYKPLLTPAELFVRRKIKLGRKNGEIRAPDILLRYNKS